MNPWGSFTNSEIMCLAFILLTFCAIGIACLYLLFLIIRGIFRYFFFNKEGKNGDKDKAEAEDKAEDEDKNENENENENENKDEENKRKKV